MPALPWVGREPLDADGTYVVMSSKLPLQRHRSMVGFLRDTWSVRRQLAGADGLVGYALNADLVRRTFWTFSVWSDQASLDAFAASEPAPHHHPAAAPRDGRDPLLDFHHDRLDHSHHLGGTPGPGALSGWVRRRGVPARRAGPAWPAPKAARRGLRATGTAG